MPELTIKTLIDEQRIEQRVTHLAKQISEDYRDTGPLVLVGVLKGAFIFLADLARRLSIAHRIEFIALSSYQTKDHFAGSVRLIMDVRSSIEGQDVLVVEDIVDSGRTLAYLHDLLGAHRPARLRTCVLVRKPGAVVQHSTVDYLGFDIPDKWVVGYGLDYDERYRTLPYIGAIDPPAG